VARYVASRVIVLLGEKAKDVEIIKGHISNDHVHIFLSVPPHLSISQLVKSIKGKSSRKLMMEYKRLSKAFWGRHIWARGYFVASSGNVTDEVIIKYIEEQGKEPPDGEFKIYN
jgi:putative transposase